MDADERTRQVLADLEQRRADMLRNYGLVQEQADAYGSWLAGLASWTHFLTFTHDPRRLSAGHTLVGRQRHRKVLSKWFHDDVRRLDPAAKFFSEMELHESGQVHEHGLLALEPNAPALSVRQAWFERGGYCIMTSLAGADEARREGAGIYVAKYTGKAAAVEPFIGGFGLHRKPSHSVSFGAAIR